MDKQVNYRYETVLDQLRRDIITGVYPVGSLIKSVTVIRDEYNIAIATAYKIHKILEAEGLVKYVERKGSYVIPFDQDMWKNKIQDAAVKMLDSALAACRESQVSKEKVAVTIQNVYTNTGCTAKR